MPSKHHKPEDSVAKLLLVTAVTLAATMPVPASSRERQEIGTLRCRISGAVGMIVTSKQRLSCNFERIDRRGDHYVGSVTKYGLNIGVIKQGELVWVVYRAGDMPPRGSLAGNYAGVGADASAGAGLGANALIGGSDRSISLQPFSAQGQVGANIAVGVTAMSLRRAR
jgi:hypothetical protein